MRQQSGQETRREPRGKVNNDGSLTVCVARITAKGKANIEARLVDLSRGGAKLVVGTSIPLQESLSFTLKVHPNDFEVSTAARVRWTRLNRPDEWSIGCSFTPPLSEMVLDELAKTGCLDRRSTRRNEISAGANVRWEMSTTPIGVKVCDVSPGGSAFVSPNPGQVGQRLMLFLRHHDDPRLAIPARAVWTGRTPQGHLVGCNFLSAAGFQRFIGQLREECGPAPCSPPEPGVEPPVEVVSDPEFRPPSKQRRMPQLPIDLRSDTVTRPGPGMRQAMADAVVGDDVYGEDPTVNKLEAGIAQLLGKEAAVFVPSGTMSNQIGVRVHCRHGDEMICESGCHIYNYEQGAYAALSGVAVRHVDGEYGVLRREQLEGLVRPVNEHLVRTRLITLENTHNRGGGRVQPYDEVADICTWARSQGLATHLDGARLFNAVVATGIPAEKWACHFDTVSVCFSKGLGAPVGSALSGTKDMIAEARRHRKLFGGAMRQAGVLAAAALYALENNVQRLEQDHANARRLAEAIAQIEGLELTPPEVDTNLVILRVDKQLGTAPQLSARLKERGILISAFSPTHLRAVTHLDVSGADLDYAASVLREVVECCQSEAALAPV